jgi:putative transposase
MPLADETRLGPYEITGPLGEGGMGKVWKARDTRLNRFVAIKRSNSRFTERFEREAHAIAAPSWLTFLGHVKDSLWSVDLFSCESLSLRTHWVLIVMDQFTRRIVGFGIHLGTVDGPALCRMFQCAIRAQGPPKFLSTDNDPLYQFHQWQTNLRVQEVQEVKTVPYVPLSHPFVERLIGTVRRECLDRTLFWTTADLGAKLNDFQHYYNEHRTHSGLGGRLPNSKEPVPIRMASYGLRTHCRRLYQTPIAA